MKLVCCDRCAATFQRDVRYTTLWIFDDLTADQMDHDAPTPAEVVELCPVCRAELRQFLTTTQVATTDEPEPEPTKLGRVVHTHTCVDCGREGSRRFIHHAGEWKCSDRTACVRRRVEPASPAPAPKPKPEPLRAPTLPTPEPEPHPPAPAPGITARCQDCPRTFNLTGVVLTQAVEMHEQKHSHIVTVYESATA